MKDPEQFDSVLVTFRAPKALADAAEAVGAKEGLTRAAVARRALLRDLAQANAEPGRHSARLHQANCSREPGLQLFHEYASRIGAYPR